MKLSDYPKTPADLEWARLAADASAPDQTIIIVQVSARKYAIGERSFIRQGAIVVPYTRLRGEERYSWTDAIIEAERRITARNASRRHTAAPPAPETLTVMVGNGWMLTAQRSPGYEAEDPTRFADAFKAFSDALNAPVMTRREDIATNPDPRD